MDATPSALYSPPSRIVQPCSTTATFFTPAQLQQSPRALGLVTSHSSPINEAASSTVIMHPCHRPTGVPPFPPSSSFWIPGVVSSSALGCAPSQSTVGGYRALLTHAAQAVPRQQHFFRTRSSCSPHLIKIERPVSQSPRTLTIHSKQKKKMVAHGVSAFFSACTCHPSIPKFMLEFLIDGPYLPIMSFLTLQSLGRVDCACQETSRVNRGPGGPWYGAGLRKYRAFELVGLGPFEEPLPVKNVLPERSAGRLEPTPLSEPAPPTLLSKPAPPSRGLVAVAQKVLNNTDWKRRYRRFAKEARMFRHPLVGSKISCIKNSDEIIYCRLKFRTKNLSDAMSSAGVYLQVEVRTNPDNVSLAIVDFEGGGCSSVTFSPDTGAVIRERKIRENPRKVEGRYIQPLSTITSGQGFEGFMGLFVYAGHLSFFRRHAVRLVDRQFPVLGDWETTGFVTDLSWSEGDCLTPCLAFRDVGAYRVRLSQVSSVPPLDPVQLPDAYQENSWRSLDWDAQEQENHDDRDLVF